MYAEHYLPVNGNFCRGRMESRSRKNLGAARREALHLSSENDLLRPCTNIQAE